MTNNGEKNKSEVLQDNKNEIEMEKIIEREFTERERYEVALRYGMYLKKHGEECETEGIKYLPNSTVKEVENETLQKVIKEIYTDNKRDGNLEKIISHDDVLKLIKTICNKYRKAGVNAGEELDTFLNNLAIITIFIKNTFKSKNFKKDYIKTVNCEIIDNAICKSFKQIDTKYFIEFLEVIYDKYGDDIEQKSFISIIEEISKSHGNKLLLTFVKELEEKFDYILLDGICNIMKLLQKNVILQPYQESDIDRIEKNEKTLELINNEEERNIKLSMVRDIINSIEFERDDAQAMIDFILLITKLSPEKLQEYWLNFSEESTNIQTANERLKRYIKIQNEQKEKFQSVKKRKLKKPDILAQKKGTKKAIKRKITIGAFASLAVVALIGAGKYFTDKNGNQKQAQEVEATKTEELDEIGTNKMEIVEGTLPIAISTYNQRGYFKAGDEIIIEHNLEDDIYIVKSEDGRCAVELNKEELESVNNVQSVLEKISNDGQKEIKQIEEVEDETQTKIEEIMEGVLPLPVEMYDSRVKFNKGEKVKIIHELKDDTYIIESDDGKFRVIVSEEELESNFHFEVVRDQFYKDLKRNEEGR